MPGAASTSAGIDLDEPVRRRPTTPLQGAVHRADLDGVLETETMVEDKVHKFVYAYPA